jgi:dTDP-4-dehydrorhamnose reductase
VGCAQWPRFPVEGAAHRCQWSIGERPAARFSSGRRRCSALSPHTAGYLLSGTSIRSYRPQAKPDVVLNTAAFHKVEECEKKPALAFEANGTAAMALLLACKRSNAVLVHFSTDYVFDGKKNAAYEETDLPAPLNVYGAPKVLGEHLIACNTDRYFVIRTCGLYGIAGSSGKGATSLRTCSKSNRWRCDPGCC